MLRYGRVPRYRRITRLFDRPIQTYRTIPLPVCWKPVVADQVVNSTSVTVIGLIGGVASGKSVVAKEFRGLGAEVIDGDKLGHLVLAEPEVVSLLRERWGDQVVDGESGQVVRREVAKRVFTDESELAFLEEVTHPRIADRIKDRIQEIAEKCQQDATHKVVILDAAIMLKAGWDKYCDKFVYVHADLEVRKNRAMDRGWTAENFEKREQAQLSVEEKRRRSDIVIDNTGCLEQTCEQVLKAWNSFSS